MNNVPEVINGTNILIAVGVLLALIGMYNVIIAAIKNFRSERDIRNTPIKDIIKRLDRHDEMLANDKCRLDVLERTASSHTTEIHLLLKGQLALIRHSIDGNNIQGLKECQTDIQSYLVEK